MKLSLLSLAAFAGAVFTLSCPAVAGGAMQIDAATRAAVVESLASEFSTRYVFPETASRAAAVLRERHKAGAFDRISDGEQFASVLSDTLRGLTKDAHVGVSFSEHVLPVRTEDQLRGLDEEGAARHAAYYSRANYGIGKIDRLPGNIGYLSIRFFGPARYTGHAIAAAMTFLNGTDALIIDLRDNQGGDPEGVAQLESYFFNQATLMNSMYFRDTDSTRQFWTSGYVPGPRYDSHKPVYILSNHGTFSAGEDMAYSMQARKRATVVGTSTGGGANPGTSRRLHPHFAAFIPHGTAINPVTKSNWEGGGVTPDVGTGAADALHAARILALKALVATQTDPEQLAGLKALLEQESAQATGQH